jgi:hypothetical protein
MPAAKPKALSQRNDTKDDRDARTAAESAMTPKSQLPLKEPALLRGHKTAGTIWRRSVELYSEVDGNIATAFDERLLAKYCLLEEECLHLEKKRSDIDSAISVLDKQINVFKRKKLTDEQYKILYKLYEQYNALIARYQGLDARLDGKRKLCFSFEQSLYLTPRSRAGVAPPVKDPEPEKSDTEKALE